MYMFVYEGGGGVKILEKMATWFVHDPFYKNVLTLFKNLMSKYNNITIVDEILVSPKNRCNKSLMTQNRLFLTMIIISD